VLDAHGDYLELPPPDRYVPASVAYPAPAARPPSAAPPSARADADREADEVGHDGGGGSDEDLASA
jgi:hypothetical protein